MCERSWLCAQERLAACARETATATVGGVYLASTMHEKLAEWKKKHTTQVQEAVAVVVGKVGNEERVGVGGGSQQR
jgi:hypothetical protein